MLPGCIRGDGNITIRRERESANCGWVARRYLASILPIAAPMAPVTA